MINKASTHVFDELRHWKQMLNQKSVPKLDTKILETMNEVAKLLLPPEELSPITRKTSFVDFVHQMNELLKNGSKALGDTIIKAAELQSSGEIEAARNVYEDFSLKCSSPFFRAIAETHIKRLE